jgi:hypothetical protein
MFRPSGRVIAATIWVVWVGTLQGKKLFPAIFGSAAFQWSGAAIVAILIPLGTLIALRSFGDPRKRRAAFGLLIACIFPLVINLSTYGVGGPMMGRLFGSLDTFNERDVEMIAKLTRQAVEGESIRHRQNAARGLYSLFGVRAVLRDDAGSLVIYDPSENEETAWRQTQETHLTIGTPKSSLEELLKQFPWLFALNLGSFSLILLGGLAWQTYRRDGEFNAAARGCDKFCVSGFH